MNLFSKQKIIINNTYPVCIKQITDEKDRLNVLANLEKDWIPELFFIESFCIYSVLGSAEIILVYKRESFEKDIEEEASFTKKEKEIREEFSLYQGYLIEKKGEQVLYSFIAGGIVWYVFSLHCPFLDEPQKLYEVFSQEKETLEQLHLRFAYYQLKERVIIREKKFTKEELKGLSLFFLEQIPPIKVKFF